MTELTKKLKRRIARFFTPDEMLHEAYENEDIYIRSTSMEEKHWLSSVSMGARLVCPYCHALQYLQSDNFTYCEKSETYSVVCAECNTTLALLDALEKKNSRLPVSQSVVEETIGYIEETLQNVNNDEEVAKMQQHLENLREA